MGAATSLVLRGTIHLTPTIHRRIFPLVHTLVPALVARAFVVDSHAGPHRPVGPQSGAMPQSAGSCVEEPEAGPSCLARVVPKPTKSGRCRKIAQALCRKISAAYATTSSIFAFSLPEIGSCQSLCKQQTNTLHFKLRIAEGFSTQTTTRTAHHLTCFVTSVKG